MSERHAEAATSRRKMIFASLAMVAAGIGVAAGRESAAAKRRKRNGRRNGNSSNATSIGTGGPGGAGGAGGTVHYP